MLPRLKQQDAIKPLYAKFLKALRETDFQGDVSSSFSDRLITATDNSIYQIMPQAVVFPKTKQDTKILFDLANKPPFKEIVFSPRGAGTSTCGQSLSTGIIIDYSRHMNHIIEFNERERWIRVEPGVVLDQLNEFLADHGLFFPVTISPSSRATLGGMANTDASGIGSSVYGKMSDHILALDAVLVDGRELHSREISATGLKVAKQSDFADIYKLIDDITTSKKDLIASTFPKLGKRCMTGYNLAKVYDESREHFNLNYILSGSEGTLASITELKLKLTPVPKHKTLFVIRYSSFQEAIENVRRLLSLGPTVVEIIDGKLLELARNDISCYNVKQHIEDAPGQESHALIFMEFRTHSEDEMKILVEPFIKTLDQDKSINGYYLTNKVDEMASLWLVRKKSVGLLGDLPGNRKPIPFIEDTIVPPENLPAYYKSLSTLLDQHHIDYGVFGHCDVGCLHIRPALDMRLEEDENLVKSISNQVANLVKEHKGIMWGEHGKGFRSAYGPEFFGPELYQALREIKKAFDPNNRLNPGKIAVAIDSNERLVAIESPMRGQYDRQIPIHVQDSFNKTIECNGNAVCFNYDTKNVICPSTKVTQNRVHSPKGRAGLMREWLRQLAHKHYDASREAHGSFYIRMLNTVFKWLGFYDYSHEVKNAMSGCLECKACKSECPIHVNVPHFKAQFLSHYYSRYQRSWREMLIARLETIAPIQAKLPRLFNFLNRLSFLFGQVDTPKLSTLNLKKALKKRSATPFSKATLKAADKSKTVILIQDVVTTFFESNLVIDTYDLLTKLGYQVLVMPYFPIGMLKHNKGYLKEFETIAQENIDCLQTVSEYDIPIIGIEPSIILCFRDEYQTVQSCDMQVQLLQEWLVNAAAPKIEASHQKAYTLLAHCSEKSLAPDATKQWQTIFEHHGLSLAIKAVGCCGMAGNYGHEKEHLANSKALFDMSWKTHFTDINRHSVVCTGYSCRDQVERMMGFRPKHPIQILLEHI